MIRLRNLVLQSGCMLVCCTSIFAQKTTLKLFIYENGKAVQKFGIANLTSNKEGVLVDGYHQITAKAGDELFLASQSFKNFYKIVEPVDIQQGSIEVFLLEGIIALEEVVLEEQKLSYGTFTVDKPVKYTPAEARLKAATKMMYKEPEEVLYKKRGVRFAFDPIINMVTGRTKQLKKELKAETSTVIVSFLQTNYRRYILEDLKVPRVQYPLFCYYVSDKNKGIHKIGEPRRVEYLLRRLYLTFLEQSQKDP